MKINIIYNKNSEISNKNYDLYEKIKKSKISKKSEKILKS